MTRLFALLLVAAGVAAVGTPAKSDAQDGKSKPGADLQGTWKLSKLYDKYEGGAKSYISVSSKYIMTVTGGELTVETETGGKKTTTKYTVELDGSKNPKVYTRTTTDGKKSAVVGIYSVEKDRLMMCFQADGKQPEGFTVTRDDGKNRRIYEFVRVKP